MKITVRIEKLLEMLNEAVESDYKVVELEIDNNELNIAAIECGGLGYCGDFDIIKGLTDEEIAEIP